MQRFYITVLACLSLYGCGGGDDSNIASAVAGTHGAAVDMAGAKVSATDASASNGATGTIVTTVTANSEASAAGTTQSVSGSISRLPPAGVSAGVLIDSASAPDATPEAAATHGSSLASVAPISVSVSATPSKSTSAIAAAPSLTGTPAASAVAGKPYLFTPSVTDSSGARLTFSIQNAPSWARYSSTTGALTGTPTTASVGTYSNIVISVSDGTHTESLPPFAISVSQVSISGNTLSWTPPSLNADGTPLGDLAGYRVSYGSSATALIETISITDPTADSYAIPTLSSGTWYFSVAGYNSSGVTGNASIVVEITL